MERDQDHLGVYLIGATALSAISWWISELTAGPEYGAPYDIPFLNYLSWFSFLLLGTGAFLLLMLGLIRVGDRMWQRKEVSSETSDDARRVFSRL